jgi:hypothetical protein
MWQNGAWNMDRLPVAIRHIGGTRSSDGLFGLPGGFFSGCFIAAGLDCFCHSLIPFGWISKESKHFFFEKKKQKTFSRWAERYDRRARKSSKVFWFFFSKKNACLLHFVTVIDPPHPATL